MTSKRKSTKKTKPKKISKSRKTMRSQSKKSKGRSFVGKDSESTLQAVIASLARTKPAFRSKKGWEDKFHKIAARIEKFEGKKKLSLQIQFRKLLENKI